MAFLVLISAFHALTMVPALSAIFLGKHRERAKGFFFRWFNKVVEAGTEAYRSTVHRILHWQVVAVVAFLATLGLTYWVYSRVPLAFIPEDDQGYVMVVVQSPQGASVEYTSDICTQIEKVVLKLPDVEGTFTIVGVGFTGNASNRAIVFVPLTSFEKRKGDVHSAASLLANMRGPLSQIQGALAIPFNPPAVQGLGNFGGFTFEVEDQGRNSVQQIADAAYGLIGQGSTGDKLVGLFTTFTANDPQYLVQIDREKAKSLQVPFTQITDALQVYMGSVYVNDIDFNNRSYRVYVQSEGRYRSKPKDIAQYYLMSDPGKLIPLDNFVKIEQTANPQVISHYNLFRSAEINGTGAPGRSSGQAIADMEALARKALPGGMTYEWSGLSLA